MTDEEDDFSKRGKGEGEAEAQMSGCVESEFMNPGERSFGSLVYLPCQHLPPQVNIL